MMRSSLTLSHLMTTLQSWSKNWKSSLAMQSGVLLSVSKHSAFTLDDADQMHTEQFYQKQVHQYQVDDDDDDYGIEVNHIDDQEVHVAQKVDNQVADHIDDHEVDVDQDVDNQRPAVFQIGPGQTDDDDDDDDQVDDVEVDQ
eukprot:815323-Amphidinium_carterae.1